MYILGDHGLGLDLYQDDWVVIVKYHETYTVKYFCAIIGFNIFKYSHR